MQPAQTVLELKKISNRLAQASRLAVAHNRKFTYICAQFERFAFEYEKAAKQVLMSNEMIQAYRDILNCANKFITLFSQNDIQGWAHTALEHSSSQVATDITTILTTLQITAVALCPTAARIFDPTSLQWLQYHLLDIRAIASSFEQYISSSNSLSIEPEITDAMNARIQSINNFCEQYKNEEAIPPGCCVFSPIPVHYQKWRLSPSDFVCEERVGHGVSASVYYGHLKKDNREVAIKKLKYKHLSGAKLQTFQREITIFATCNHPCILNFIGATDSPPFCIISEWMPGGNLFHDLHKNHSLDATFLSIALFDIARGMAFLHSRQIMHRDLKSLNILIDRNKLTHICDFGFSRKTGEKDEKLTKNVGTPIWMAPELLNTTNGYDLKIDVYAYAIVAWELLTGDTPYGNADPSQIIGDVLVHDARPLIPNRTPAPIVRLITQCWDRDPAKRPEFSEIVQRIVRERIFLPEADGEYVMAYMRRAGYDPAKEDDVDVANLDSALRMDPSSPGFFAGIVRNLTSERGIDAARAFRHLTSIPFSYCLDAIALVPTGNEKIDEQIIIGLCKNGHPGPACLHALKNEHLQLTFEVISRLGPPLDNASEIEEKDAIVDRCLRCLHISEPTPDQKSQNQMPQNRSISQNQVPHNCSISQNQMPQNRSFSQNQMPHNCSIPQNQIPQNRSISQNQMPQNCLISQNQMAQSAELQFEEEDVGLAVSALRCLLKIGGLEKIPMGALKQLILLEDTTGKGAVCVVVAKLAESGVKLPMEIVDLMIQTWKTDVISCLVVIAACREKEIAEHVMGYINSGDVPEEKALTNLVTMMSIHKELHSPLKAFVEATIAQSKDRKISEQANALLKKMATSSFSS